MSFEQFINNPVGRKLQNQLDWITINGEIEVDFIGRHEYLQEDFNVVCDYLSFEPITLPVYNKTDHEHYSTYYNEDTKAIVAELFAKDIEYFGYKFGKI
jgi:hypothetical protein